jgi:hypothetical protein
VILQKPIERLAFESGQGVRFCAMQQKQGFGVPPIDLTVRGFPSKFFNFFGYKK